MISTWSCELRIFNCRKAKPINSGMYPETSVLLRVSFLKEPIHIIWAMALDIQTTDEKRARYDMPSDAVYAFTNYIPGGGNFYYGKLEDKYTLGMYEGYLDEQGPDATYSGGYNYWLVRTLRIGAEGPEIRDVEE